MDPFRIEYTWTPHLRTMAIAEDGRRFPDIINAAMEWLDEQPWWSGVFLQGTLNRRQCRLLWDYLGRTDKVPKRLALFVNREDLERLYPGIMDDPLPPR
jgi:hypothetical protein